MPNELNWTELREQMFQVLKQAVKMSQVFLELDPRVTPNKTNLITVLKIIIPQNSLSLLLFTSS